MNFLQTVNSYSGLLSMVFAIAAAIYAARYVSKSQSSNSATNTATEAQEKAIHALETRLEVQEKDINDLKRENSRLQLILETIKAALKGRGLIITIDGEMITIGDGSSSTTAHIRQNGL
jgi:cell shape-determining protein MreC